MEFIDFFMIVFGLAFPPIIIYVIKKRIIGFLIGTLFFWFLLFANGYYHALYTPGYDSIAPGLSLFFGWAIGAVYCAFWVLIIFIARMLWKRIHMGLGSDL